MSEFDQDAVVAAADLAGRSGAREFEIGYLHDDVPAEEAGWYAHAKFRGARLTAEGPGPVEAAEALMRRILAGAQCRRCGRTILLSDGGEGCRWHRMGAKWEPGCGKPIDQSIAIPGFARRS